MPLDFLGQIVKSLQILSHLLLVVAIFPLPHPCAIRFPKSKSSNPHKSYLICFAVVAIQLFLILHHFPVVSPGVSLRCVSPGRRLQLLTVQTVLSSEAVGASSSKRLPGETQRVPLHFPDQIVKSPEILSHLLLVVAIFSLPHPCAIRFPKSNRQIPTSSISSSFSGRYSTFSHFTSFSCCVSRCVSPGKRLQLLTVQTVLSSQAVGASSSKRLPGEKQRRDTTGAIAFPRPNRQISRNPISSAFSGCYFSLAAPMCH